MWSWSSSWRAAAGDSPGAWACTSRRPCSTSGPTAASFGGGRGRPSAASWTRCSRACKNGLTPFLHRGQVRQPPLYERAKAVLEAGLLREPQRLLERPARLRVLVVAALLEAVVADDDQLVDPLGGLLGIDLGHAAIIAQAPRPAPRTSAPAAPTWAGPAPCPRCRWWARPSPASAASTRPTCPTGSAPRARAS